MNSLRVRTQGITTACIVIPTYNEAGNIVRLLDAIFEQEKLHPKMSRLKVLVVDDSSPDGTADLVAAYQKKNSAVHLLIRTKKEGLGAAYVAGMRYALFTLKPDILFEMDADFSHRPEYIYPMLYKLSSGYDFVIGSRYLAKSKLPDDWGFRRIMISKVANFLSKTAIQSPARDCTSGFRAIKASLLQRLNWYSITTKGYAFQVSFLAAALALHASVAEIPINFPNRTRGESKLRITDILELALFLAKTAFARLSRYARAFPQHRKSVS